MNKIAVFLVALWGLFGAIHNPVGAYLGTVEGSLDVATENYKVGDKFSAKVMVNTGSARVSVVYVNLQVDASKLKVTGVVANRSKFEGVYMEKESGGIVSVYVTSSKPTSQLPQGNFELATVNFEAVGAGNAEVSLRSYEITGPSSTSDYSYQLNWKLTTFNLTGVVVTPTPIVGNGTDGILKFKMSYAGVRSSSTCVGNWPVSVTIIGGGQNRTYEGIKLTESGEQNGLKVFTGEVLLSGLNTKKDLAVFLKGPRHIQVKYGKNMQDSFYNQPGGTIFVEANSTLTPVYDFTRYPVVAGDVTGVSGGQDGVVDGRDFAFVKSEVNKRLEGSNLTSDLNGNCKLESQDLALLMLAMKDRQSQLY